MCERVLMRMGWVGVWLGVFIKSEIVERRYILSS